MSDNGFFADTIYVTQSSVTPDISTMTTVGTGKLLVVIFIVDCSQSMAGERIQAVNAALREVKSALQDMKRDNGLELKIAVMSFTSSARWHLDLTDIDEVSLENLTTRPGLTEYGNAFHELNKVLSKNRFMKHTGKKAPPAIMFLTDGEPTDQYQDDLEELKKNPWFANASRSAVLLGDAISNEKAREAVSRFVEDANNDIVDAENSTKIIRQIRIATMHTVAGEPMVTGSTNEVGGQSAVPNDIWDPDVPGTDPDNPAPYGENVGSDVGIAPLGEGSSGVSDPFVGSATGVSDPFAGSTTGASDPFAGSTTGVSDPFAGSTTGVSDPFTGSSFDPSGDPNGGNSADPFAFPDGEDPFA